MYIQNSVFQLQSHSSSIKVMFLKMCCSCIHIKSMFFHTSEDGLNLTMNTFLFQL